MYMQVNSCQIIIHEVQDPSHHVSSLQAWCYTCWTWLLELANGGQVRLLTVALWQLRAPSWPCIWGSARYSPNDEVRASAASHRLSLLTVDQLLPMQSDTGFYVLLRCRRQGWWLSDFLNLYSVYAERNAYSSGDKDQWRTISFP